MNLLIYGSQEFASTVRVLARHCGHNVVGMIDDYNTGPGILGSMEEVLDRYPPQSYGISLAVGYKNLDARWRAWERILSLGYGLPKLIHPSAYVADTSSVGDGSMIMAGAVVDTSCQVGRAVVIWPGSCINHDVIVGDNSFISPNATICGAVKIGSHSFVGAGAVIVDHLTLSPKSFIRAAERYTGDKS